MSQSLQLLALNREARREAAMVELAVARRQFDLARAACEQAHLDAEQSRRWHTEMLARCTLGQGRVLRESLLPACEALLHQRLQQVCQTQSAMRLAHEYMTAQLQDLAARERDILRLQEWQQLQQSQRRLQHAMQENLDDDEHMPRRPNRASAVP